MTTQGCPLHETLVQDVTRYVKKVPGVNNVNVNIVWDPPWSMDKMTDEGKSMMKSMGGQKTLTLTFFTPGTFFTNRVTS